MKTCIVKGCIKKTKKGAMPGSDDSFYCEKHKRESRERLLKESKSVIQKIAKDLLK